MHRLHRPLQLLCAGTLALLTGCADTNWERAFYDGFHRCQTNLTADHAPCPATKTYDQYERERNHAQERAAPVAAPAANNPIEEKQL